MTDSCYQFNFQATLSWTEAWLSCQQQGADLLSITKLHEQTYINGTEHSLSSVKRNSKDNNGLARLAGESLTSEMPFL